jgi:adenosylcobyric acid synthase
VDQKPLAINKFRGDPTLFADGMTAITDHNGYCHWALCRGLMMLENCPPKTCMDTRHAQRRRHQGRGASSNRIANFDDLDPLVAQPDVTVEIYYADAPPGETLTLIPVQNRRSPILRIFSRPRVDTQTCWPMCDAVRLASCGYQMLGCEIADPRTEGPATRACAGLVCWM